MVYKTPSHDQVWRRSMLPSINMQPSTLLRREPNRADGNFGRRYWKDRAKAIPKASPKDKAVANCGKSVAFDEEPTSVYSIVDEPTRRIRERLFGRKLSALKLLSLQPKASILKKDCDRSQGSDRVKFPKIRLKRKRESQTTSDSSTAKLLDFKCSSDFEKVYGFLTRK